jgi:hypothetical protein
MQISLDHCPTCGTELSQTKYREIRLKLEKEEQNKRSELAEARLAITRQVEQELRSQFDQERASAEKKARAEADQLVKKAIAERDQAAKKLKDAEGREAEIRKQAQSEIERHKQIAEKRAKADSEQQVKKLISERDQATKKLKEAEGREAEIRKQVVQESEKQKQKELADTRTAFEKDKTTALFKQQAEFNRHRESLEKKIQIMQNQVRRKTANELGDGGEIDVFEALRGAFDGNTGKTTRIPKGQCGADLVHEVFHKGEACGRIVVDAKNRQAWQNGFVSKLRQDQVEAGAEHAILATTVFPAGKKDLCIESGVIVVNPVHIVHLVQLLRQAMLSMHMRGLSLKQRTDKMTRLYKLITSESHAGKLTEASRLTQDILDLDVQEKKAHDNVWKRRGSLAMRIRNVLREVETDISAVIEGAEDGVEVLPISPSEHIPARQAS